MKAFRSSVIAAISAAALSLVLPHATQARAAGEEAPMKTISVGIPQSVRAEHAAIHAGLEQAMRAPGRVGVAARALAAVLHPHFAREEQIALPPLGLLAPLAAGDSIPASVAAEALAMSDSLRSELPHMLAEHVKIRAAVAALRRAAVAQGAKKPQELADALALHARNEEEVMYPAAVLVGDLLRARRAARD